jgi:pheromone shutdown protein TraB
MDCRYGQDQVKGRIGIGQCLIRAFSERSCETSFLENLFSQLTDIFMSFHPMTFTAHLRERDQVVSKNRIQHRERTIVAAVSCSFWNNCRTEFLNISSFGYFG